MKLHTLKISGFKRLKQIQVNFGDATFLIGQNNCGKSSILILFHNVSIVFSF
ncbi:AAA family ATPase [Pedobacter panaciterrae]